MYPVKLINAEWKLWNTDWHGKALVNVLCYILIIMVENKFCTLWLQGCSHEILNQTLDGDGVRLRKSGKLKRRKYCNKLRDVWQHFCNFKIMWIQGPNFLWHLDGYDELKPFGICIHGCIDGLQLTDACCSWGQLLKVAYTSHTIKRRFEISCDFKVQWYIYVIPKFPCCILLGTRQNNLFKYSPSAMRYVQKSSE